MKGHRKIRIETCVGRTNLRPSLIVRRKCFFERTGVDRGDDGNRDQGDSRGAEI